MDKKPTIAIILPVANERGIIRDALKRLCALGADEVIVVDGSSSDGTFQIIQDEFLVVSEPFDVAQGKLRESNPPAVRRYQTVFKDRALQMNVGAFEAKSDVFIFVHADMVLPPNAVSVVRERVRRGFVGGGFKKCYATNDWVLKIYCFFTNLIFFRVSRSLVGTNAIFVARDVFERIGGFEQGGFMEDVVFGEKLKKIGRITLIQDAVKVSPRRYEEKGVLRQIAKNAEILFRYRVLRQNPSNLREIYEIKPKKEEEVMKKISSVVMGTLFAGMLAFGVAPVMAGEHGGSAVKEHGGNAAAEGSHGMEMKDEVAILQQAAKELKATNPELSSKLEELAKKHQM